MLNTNRVGLYDKDKFIPEDHVGPWNVYCHFKTGPTLIRSETSKLLSWPATFVVVWYTCHPLCCVYTSWWEAFDVVYTNLDIKPHTLELYNKPQLSLHTPWWTAMDTTSSQTFLTSNLLPGEFHFHGIILHTTIMTHRLQTVCAHILHSQIAIITAYIPYTPYIHTKFILNIPLMHTQSYFIHTAFTSIHTTYSFTCHLYCTLAVYTYLYTHGSCVWLFTSPASAGMHVYIHKF